MRDVIPIVCKAKDESALPGFERFVEGVKVYVDSAYKNAATARLSALEVARQICVFSADPVLQKRVDALNLEEAAKRLKETGKQGGSPTKASTYVTEALAIECGVTTRTLRNWQSDWREIAGHLKCELACTADAFTAARLEAAKNASLPKFFDAIDAQLAVKAPAQERLIAPEVEAERSATRAIELFLDEAGKPRLDPVRFAAWFKVVKPVIDAHGVKIAPPKQGR